MTEKKSPVISFKDFSFQYRAQKKPTLTGINLDIYPGEKVLIAGPSGSGKSTLAGCVNGLNPFSNPGECKGTLTVDGVDAPHSSIFELSAHVGTVLQDPDGQFIGLTVGEDIAFALENSCTPQDEMHEITRHAAELVGIENHLDYAPHELSGGQKQRVSLAGVMVDQVKILLFDEPLANLDPAAGKQAIELIDGIQKKTDTTVLIIEHRLEDVLWRNVDRIVLVNEGKILADMTPDELLSTSLLADNGIREPLYVTAMRYAGIDITKEKKPAHVDSVVLDDIDRKKLQDWFEAQPIQEDAGEREKLLEVRNLSFGYTKDHQTLRNVSLSIDKGEMVSIVGRNGAGKSTFIKVITGVHQAEEGEIFINGEKVEIKNPKDAQKLSIAAIYQHGTAYQHLSVTENIFIGHEKMTKFHTIDWKQMHKDAKALLERLGSDIDPHSSMGNLTVAEQQIVEIAKAISTNAKIIIMDEPTAALSKRECEELYRITEQLRDEGCSIIFISHRFEDMYRLATRVTVFRDSQYIGTWNVDEISNEVLISKMVGREISQIYPKQEVERGEEIFRVEGLSKTGYYKDVSFSLHKGEILAMTGLVGAGRTEVCQGIMGIERPDKGKVILEGKTLSIKHPSDAMKAGIGYLPEDRQKQGLILDWGLGQNVTLSTLEKFTKFTVINRKAERERSKELLEKVKTKALSVFDKASSLSGGNQQKVIVAKVLNSDLKVVILDEPTKGVDVGAKAQIYEIMSELAAQGFGVIMISSEMPEVLGMADTILVMKEGRVSKIFADATGVTQEQILEAAMNM